MADKELKKLTRKELLELLIEQGKENQRLQQELAEANARLSARDVKISESGSLAEASLKLNGVFKAVDAAVKMYIDSTKECAQQDAERILEEAREQAVKILRAAERHKTASGQNGNNK